MKTILCFILGVLIAGNSMAQSHHEDHQTQALSFVSVMSQALSDQELSAFRLESSVMTIIPGGADTVAHRHDCDLFGFVIEGQVEIGLNKNPATMYKSGQMFHEPRNVLHTLARNPDPAHQSRVLIIFVIKEGRQSYTPAYPLATKK